MLSKSVIEDVLNAALTQGADFGEIFMEDKYSTSLGMVAGQVETGISGRDYGVGIRVFAGLKAVYAYTNETSRDNLIKVAREAAMALNSSSCGQFQDLQGRILTNAHPVSIYPDGKDKEFRVNLMRMAYEAAKNYNPVIEQVRIRFMDEDQRILVANTEGVHARDRRIRTRMMIEAVAAKGSEKQSGFYGPGAHMGLEFYEKIDIREYAKEAARIAATMIDADYCPSGKFPVIIDNEFGGVIFHEACGHSLEATSVAKKTSVFADKLGRRSPPISSLPMMTGPSPTPGAPPI